MVQQTALSVRSNFDVHLLALSEFLTFDGLVVQIMYLVCSGHGELVISILIDLNGFWTYENREVLVTDSAKEAELAVK